MGQELGIYISPSSLRESFLGDFFLVKKVRKGKEKEILKKKKARKSGFDLSSGLLSTRNRY